MNETVKKQRFWSIDKTFDFCYGHRVWTQTLDPELSCNSSCKCRHQHGHQGQIKVFLKSNELKDGMVLDFVELNWFKKWVDDVLDHKMILDISDPGLQTFYPLCKDIYNVYGPSTAEFLQYHTEGYFTVWPDKIAILPPHEKEIYEGLVLVPFIPTSENLSKWLFDVVQNKLNDIAVVEKIEFNETPKSRSTYYG